MTVSALRLAIIADDLCIPFRGVEIEHGEVFRGAEIAAHPRFISVCLSAADSRSCLHVISERSITTPIRKRPALRPAFPYQADDRSVSCDHWRGVTAEAVVEAQGEHVHVLSDPVVERIYEDPRNVHSEGVVRIPHPQMVVFSTERPVGGEAIFKADTQDAASTCRACADQADSGGIVDYVKPIAGDGRATLDVEGGRIPRPTELAREKSDAVGLHAG